MHGLGNNFVVDGRDELFQPAHEEICWVCNRHVDVSGDQLLAIEPAVTTDAPARMRIYNIDSAEAQTGLNAFRCSTRLPLRGSDSNRLVLKTPGGMIEAACERSWCLPAAVAFSGARPTDLKVA